MRAYNYQREEDANYLIKKTRNLEPCCVTRGILLIRNLFNL